MDALTWFKSVFHRESATPLRADVATEQWDDVPLHLAAARLRPATARVDDDDDWNAVIARAKMEAASPKAPSPHPPRLPHHAPAKAPSPPPPPSQRDEWAEMPATPPPSPAQQERRRSATLATLNALASGSLKKPAMPRPGFASRRPAAAGPLFSPAKRT
jgi:hypothetical protein